jgi:hypothetical protein
MKRSIKWLIVILIVCGVTGGYIYRSSTPDYEGYLTGVDEGDSFIGMSINGKSAMIKVNRNTKLLDDKGNVINIGDFYLYNWGKVWLKGKHSDEKTISGEAVKIIGVQDDTKDITGLGPYTGPADTHDYGHPDSQSKQ